jgi:hypothetical protein
MSGRECGMAGRYPGSYLRRLTDWRVVAILADIGELHSSDASHLEIPLREDEKGTAKNGRPEGRGRVGEPTTQGTRDRRKVPTLAADQTS